MVVTGFVPVSPGSSTPRLNQLTTLVQRVLSHWPAAAILAAGDCSGAAWEARQGACHTEVTLLHSGAFYQQFLSTPDEAKLDVVCE